MLKKILNNTDFVYFLSSISLFYYLFGHTLEYGRQFDDFMLESTFLSSPGDAKLYSSFLYAKFHFYPIYFLSHELDNFLTFIFSPSYLTAFIGICKFLSYFSVNL